MKNYKDIFTVMLNLFQHLLRFRIAQHLAKPIRNKNNKLNKFGMTCVLLISLCLTSHVCSAQQPLKFTQKKDTFELVVSFISKGSGIDGKTKDKINTFIQNFPKKPAFEICQMGREGETTYLFHLKELKEHEKKKFIKELKEQITDKEMVHIEENKLFNSRCRG